MCFFFKSLSEKKIRSSLHSLRTVSKGHSVLPQDSPVFVANIVQRSLVDLQYWVSQEVVSVLDAFLRHMSSTKWKITLQRFKGLLLWWGFKRPVVWVILRYSLQGKGQVTVPYTFYLWKKRCGILKVSSFGKQHVVHLKTLFWSI